MSTRPLRGTRREVLVVLLVSAIVAFAFQGSRHLYDPDEGRYTDVAHQMTDLGDWLVPHLDPERPHFTKPPLTYWTLAASFRAFGNNEWAARLPNALAFIGTALLVLGLARRLGLAAPAFAACAWATSWGPVLGMNVVTTDTLLTSFETLAVYGIVASGLVAADARPRASGLRLMWLGFGLAFLTKGPPGLLPLAAIVTFVAWRRRRDSHPTEKGTPVARRGRKASGPRASCSWIAGLPVKQRRLCRELQCRNPDASHDFCRRPARPNRQETWNDATSQLGTRRKPDPDDGRYLPAGADAHGMSR